MTRLSIDNLVEVRPLLDLSWPEPATLASWARGADGVVPVETAALRRESETEADVEPGPLGGGLLRKLDGGAGLEGLGDEVPLACKASHKSKFVCLDVYIPSLP
jgi:hypothetical protein